MFRIQPRIVAAVTVGVLCVEGQILRTNALQLTAGQQQEDKPTNAAAGYNNKIAEKLNGQWVTIKLENSGKETPEAELKALKLVLTFTDKNLILTYVINNDDFTVKATFTIDTTKTPLEMDWSDLVQTSVNNPNENKIPVKTIGIFELDGDTLKIHFRAHFDGNNVKGNAVKRPADFTKSEAGHFVDALMTLQRVKP